MKSTMAIVPYILLTIITETSYTYHVQVSRVIACGSTVRGKSELRRAGSWVTPSGGDPQESATETYRRLRR